MLSHSPMFSFTDREELNPRYKHSSIISLPMYAFYAGISMSQMKYKRVSIRLIDSATKSDEDRLYKEIKKALPGLYA